MNIDQFDGGAPVLTVGAMQFDPLCDAGASDLVDPHETIDFLVGPDRLFEGYSRMNHMGVKQGLAIGDQTHGPQELRCDEVGIFKIARVEDDRLGVNFGKTDAESMGEGEIGSGHGSRLQRGARPGQTQPCRFDAERVATQWLFWQCRAMTNWRTSIEPFTRPLFFAYSRLTRGMTLGVRGVATDERGRVLLVKHTYLPGWWLPGGGVDRGETTQDAVLRELREEAGLIALRPARLISIHSNERFFPGDHVLVFGVEAFTLTERTSHGEIAETGWFDPDDLPEDAHRSTRARLAEIFAGAPIDPAW